MSSNFNIESTLKTYGITGHPVVDSMIFAQLIPIIFAYGSFLTKTVKTLMAYLFTNLLRYFSTKYLKNFMSAKLVLYTEIKKTHTVLYHFMLNDILKNDDIHSDKGSTQFTDIIGNLMNNNSSNKDDNSSTGTYYNAWKVKWDAEYDLYLSTIANGDGNRITYSKSWKRDDLNEDMSKTFLYEGLIIKLALVGINTNASRIDVHVYQLKKDNTKKFKLSMFEEFLRKRFNYITKIPVIQTVEIKSNSITRHLSNTIRNNMQDPVSGTLNCGDGIYEGMDTEDSSDKKEDIYNFIKVMTNDGNNIVFDDSVKDYQNKLKFECYTTSQIQNEDNFNGLYQKYINSSGSGDINGSYGYGYFYHNNMLIMLYGRGSGYVVTIISHHKVCSLSDIKVLLNQLLTNKLSNQKIKKTKKTKMPINIYKRVDGDWCVYELDIRSFDTIYLPEKVMSEITYEFEKFSEMKSLYKMYQIPYRKGILFYGPPGTGKTSLVKALAYEHQMSIYVINVNDSDVNDDSISNILSSIGKSGSKILLFEDIDSAFSDKEVVKHGNKTTSKDKDEISDKKSKLGLFMDNMDEKKDIDTQKPEPSKTHPAGYYRNNDDDDDTRDLMRPVQNKFLTYSGLLNALDGVLSGHEGVITVMTTNYVENLGQAFLRPGRIDRKFNLNYCNDEQIYKMIHNFVKQRLALMEKALKEKEEESEEDPKKIKLNAFETEYADRNSQYLDYNYLDDKVRQFVDYLMNSETKYTPAQMQQYLIRNIENIDNIFDNVGQIKESYDCT